MVTAPSSQRTGRGGRTRAPLWFLRSVAGPGRTLLAWRHSSRARQQAQSAARREGLRRVASRTPTKHSRPDKAPNASKATSESLHREVEPECRRPFRGTCERIGQSGKWPGTTALTRAKGTVLKTRSSVGPLRRFIAVVRFRRELKRCGDFLLGEPPADSFVREPRRPKPWAPATGAALDLPE